MPEKPPSKVATETRSGISNSRLRMLGFLPLIFFIAQGIHYWRINQLGHMLWMCNIGNLLLALGLFLNRPPLIRAPAIWTIPGLLMWLLLIVRQYGVVFASVLAHVGGAVVAVVVLRRVRVDRGAWLHALVWYCLVQEASRLTTPVEFNVNASQTIYPGFENAFNAYWKFWLVLRLLVAMMLWILTLLLNRLWPPVREESP